MIEHDRIISGQTEQDEFVTDRSVRPRLLTEFVGQLSIRQKLEIFLAAAIGEEADTVEDTIDPYLIQQGLLMRTPRGQQTTVHAYRAMGFDASPTAPATEACPCA